MGFFRHVEVDRRLPVVGGYTKSVRRLGLFRKVWCYDFTSRERFERAMQLAPLATRVIKFIGLGR